MIISPFLTVFPGSPQQNQTAPSPRTPGHTAVASFPTRGRSVRVAVGCEGGVNRLWWPHLEGRERLRAAQTAGGRGSGYCQQATWKTGDWGVGWGGGGSAKLSWTTLDLSTLKALGQLGTGPVFLPPFTPLLLFSFFFFFFYFLSISFFLFFLFPFVSLIFLLISPPIKKRERHF